MYESEQGVDKLIDFFDGILYWKAIQPFFDLVKNCSGIGERWPVVGESVIGSQKSVTGTFCEAFNDCKVCALQLIF